MNFLRMIPLVFFIFFVSKASGQASNKIPQISTLPKGIVKVRVNAPSNRVQIFKTKGTRISIETSIRINAGSLPLLDYLAKNGRYELNSTVDLQTNTLTLTPKKNQKTLLVKGEECQEVITYKIHIPESVKFVETLNIAEENFVVHQ
ncbi:hypothetical protein [Aureispira anguillae]|uniref:Auto-transporter adhesin head GIN domain-containing protein n=1 Tax=Aureispira anguillae TaxID=2864201 RepID=A0A915YI81_9BACT|nr:hypothetical protein [Aureispira anguillae]BDS13670.1 hypothetical protein AsAng_0044090 [Aureispira anguillae]